jgi:hypothetical protein
MQKDQQRDPRTAFFVSPCPHLMFLSLQNPLDSQIDFLSIKFRHKLSWAAARCQQKGVRCFGRFQAAFRSVPRSPQDDSSPALASRAGRRC